MALIRINDVSISLGGPLLLDCATLLIEEGERIGLLGRNGSGKSTLMKMLNGDIPADRGEIVRDGNIRVALLPQDVPEELPGTVFDIVSSGGQEYLDLLRQYHDLTMQLAHSDEEDILKKLERVQHELETSGAWHFHQRIKTVITWASLDEEAEFRLLSAGLKRRVMLAKALVNEPDLLLLDEPTNHLDINSILWLEEFLIKYDKTIMFVTHDRAFLQRVATRIVEIDRGRLVSFDCDYATYLDRRQAMLDAEAKARQEFDKKLVREEVWVRQGIKARRSRNEGRVRALLQLRRERDLRREHSGNARILIQEAERSGKLVVDAEKIRFAYGEKKIIENFSTTIIRGDKVGIIGPNGSGKTTLLKILLGDLKPQQGRLRPGAGLKVAYFDQVRAQLDEDRTLKDNVADGNDTVFIGDAPRHIIGYLKDFLFSPSQILAPVRSLSGGERNRLLLAKLFSTPSNVLVLDEPTNDLDTETLELLEERLLDYSGTILLVSHDRAFLNNVVGSTIVFEGDGRLEEYVGGYDDWLRQRPAPATPETPKASAKEERPKKERAPREKRKLSFKEARELEALPQTIELLEREKTEIVAALSSPEFYAKGDPTLITATNERLKALDMELDAAYGRWEELDDLATKLNSQEVHK
ncbi:MAG: ATP-binding cassette domain-containing protein [Syntrophobacteraceae bacterium]